MRIDYEMIGEVREGRNMDLAERQPPVDKSQPVARKKYRKPSVQVYGTLSEMTNSAPHRNKGTTDKFAPGYQQRT